MGAIMDVRRLADGCDEVLRAVSAGESFIIAHNGTPIAWLRPLASRTFVPKEELLRGARLPPIDGVELRAELDELYDQDPWPDR